MLSKKDVVEINKEFDKGIVVNNSSLEYAVKTTARNKNWLKTAAIFKRAILIDHIIEDGNIKTAAAVIGVLMKINKIEYKPEEIPKIVIKILRNSIISIKETERCIKNAIR